MSPALGGEMSITQRVIRDAKPEFKTRKIWDDGVSRTHVKSVVALHEDSRKI